MGRPTDLITVTRCRDALKAKEAMIEELNRMRFWQCLQGGPGAIEKISRKLNIIFHNHTCSLARPQEEREGAEVAAIAAVFARQDRAPIIALERACIAVDAAVGINCHTVDTANADKGKP